MIYEEPPDPDRDVSTGKLGHVRVGAPRGEYEEGNCK